MRWRLYRPKWYAIVLMTKPNKISSAYKVRFNTYWLLGRSSCYSPSTKELHGLGENWKRFMKRFRGFSCNRVNVSSRCYVWSKKESGKWTFVAKEVRNHFSFRAGNLQSCSGGTTFWRSLYFHSLMNLLRVNAKLDIRRLIKGWTLP